MNTSVLKVSAEHTAQAMGSGDMPVLATPALVALMENAAMNAVRPFCLDGETTVGSSIHVEHLKPSPIGALVQAIATIKQQDGRRLSLTIEAYQGDVLIGTATHTRFIVSRERFLGKL